MNKVLSKMQHNSLDVKKCKTVSLTICWWDEVICIGSWATSFAPFPIERETFPPSCYHFNFIGVPLSLSREYLSHFLVQFNCPPAEEAPSRHIDGPRQGSSQLQCKSQTWILLTRYFFIGSFWRKTNKNAWTSSTWKFSSDYWIAIM